MSLINQMLRDLDSRRDDERGNGTVRAVTAERRRNTGWAIALGALGVVALATWLLWPATVPTGTDAGETRQAEAPDPVSPVRARLREMSVVQTREGSRLRLDFEGESGYRRRPASDHELALALEAELPEAVMALTPPGIESIEVDWDEDPPRLRLALDPVWQAGPLYRESTPDGGDRLMLVLHPAALPRVEAVSEAEPPAEPDPAAPTSAVREETAPASEDEANGGESTREPQVADEAASSENEVVETIAESPQADGDTSPEASQAMLRERRVPDAGEQAEQAVADAERAWDDGQTGEAETLLRHALALQPAHVTARDILAELLVHSGRLNQADQLLAEAMTVADMAPADVGYLARQRARLWMEGEDSHRAIEALQAVYPTLDDADRSGALLAGLLYQAGRHEAAVRHYETLVRRNPSEGAWWMGLGLAREGLADRTGAIEAYENALAGDGLRPAVRDYLHDRITELESGR